MCAVGQEFYTKCREGISISFEEGFLQFVICFDNLKENEIRGFKENKFEQFRRSHSPSIVADLGGVRA